jgi:methionyl aminopeptidase
MSIENQQDWDRLREIGGIVRVALTEMKALVQPGITTAELNTVGARVLRRHGARSAPMLFYNFPVEICISVNHEIVHGIPSDRPLEPGDLVTLDVTAEKDGYVADAAVTVGVEPVCDRHRALIACAERAFVTACDVARAGHRIYHIGRAVEYVVKQSGFRVIRGLFGHGIGRGIHEPPTVPNYYDFRACQRLTEGLVLTIEPMISLGSGQIAEAGDGWTVVTADGALSAHYEQTIVITKGRPVVLTAAA